MERSTIFKNGKPSISMGHLNPMGPSTQGTLWRGRLVGRAAGDPGGLGVPPPGPHGVLAEDGGDTARDGRRWEKTMENMTGNMRDHGITVQNEGLDTVAEIGDSN